MTAQPTGTPPALAHNVRYNNVLHKRVVVLPVATARVPPVPDEERLSIQPLGHHIFNVRVQYGFMEEPNVLDARSKRASKGLRLTLTMSRIPRARNHHRDAPRGRPIWREKAVHADGP